MRLNMKKIILNNLKKIYWVMSFQFGLDFRRTFKSLLGLKRFLPDLVRYRMEYKGVLEIKPCLHDWYEEGGATKSEYFWQDLLVAKMIFSANPKRHLDIGSRVDGFVAHVASFREIDVLDVRPITAQIPGVTFKQADLMRPLKNMSGVYDSVSCLHALEHFGLGRYGDPIDSKGSENGLANIASILCNKGVLYLSVPIGVNRVEFNANRVFDPRIIIDFALKNSLNLIELTLVHDDEVISMLIPDEEILSDLAKRRYTLGIFTFIKA